HEERDAGHHDDDGASRGGRPEGPRRRRQPVPREAVHSRGGPLQGPVAPRTPALRRGAAMSGTAPSGGPPDEVLREFLSEGLEVAEKLDRDLVALERNPGDRDLLSAVFRG